MKRADERTRTADLLITSDNSCVAGVCTRLQIPHIQRGFLSLHCCLLHRIAFPVVSEWYQYYPRIWLRLRASFAAEVSTPVEGYPQLHPRACPSPQVDEQASARSPSLALITSSVTPTRRSGAEPRSRKTRARERIRPTPPRLEQAVFRLELPGLLPGPVESAVDQSTYGRRGGWSPKGSRGWVTPRPAARGRGCRLRSVGDRGQHVGGHRRLVHVERTAAFDNSVHLPLRARITFLSAEGSLLAKSLMYVLSPNNREFGVPEALTSHLESGSLVALSKADVSLRRHLHFHSFEVARQGS